MTAMEWREAVLIACLIDRQTIRTRSDIGSGGVYPTPAEEK